MVKFIALLLFLTLSFACGGQGAIAFPAFPSLCRNVSNHLICIKSINRSAKNYWEYRAVVSIDGVDRPIEVYNCRDRPLSGTEGDRVKIRHDGTVVPFEQQGAAELICSFFQK